MRASTIKELIDGVNKLQEQEILNQLNWLIKRGIIIIESTQPILVQNTSSSDHVVEMMQGVRLVVKDKEYIECLEAENQKLKTIFEALSKSLNDLNFENGKMHSV